VRQAGDWSSTVSGVLATRCATVARVTPAPALRALRIRLADAWDLRETLPGRGLTGDGWHVTLARHSVPSVDARQATILDGRLARLTIGFSQIELVLTNKVMAESRTRVLVSIPLPEAP